MLIKCELQSHVGTGTNMTHGVLQSSFQSDFVGRCFPTQEDCTGVEWQDRDCKWELGCVCACCMIECSYFPEVTLHFSLLKTEMNKQMNNPFFPGCTAFDFPCQHSKLELHHLFGQVLFDQDFCSQLCFQWTSTFTELPFYHHSV